MAWEEKNSGNRGEESRTLRILPYERGLSESVFQLICGELALWEACGLPPCEDSLSFHRLACLCQCFVAVRGSEDEIVGIVLMDVSGGCSMCASGSIRLLLVRRDLRGRGIGSRLLREIEQDADQCAVGVISLSTEASPDSRRFFAKRGYTEVSGREELMRKKL